MAASTKKKSKTSASLADAESAIEDALNPRATTIKKRAHLKRADAAINEAEANGASADAANAYRIAVYSLQGRYDEALTLVRAAKDSTRYIDNALGTALAAATEADQRKLLDACLKKAQAKPVLLENPITVANVLGQLVGMGRNKEACTIAIEHVKKMSSRGMTPVLYTNALLAFASADETGPQATKLVKDIEKRLAERDGAYFKNNGPTRKDLRGSCYAWLGLFYARKNNVARVIACLESSAKVGYPDLTLTELHPALSTLKKHPQVKAVFNRETNTAIAQKTKLIEKNPRDWWAIFSRGLLHHERNDLELAKVDYDRTIKLNPNYADVYNNMANLLLAKSPDDREEAVRWYGKAIDRSNDFAIARRNRAEALLQIGDAKSAKKALVDATTAIRVEPKNPVAYFLAALASAALRDIKAAKAHAKAGMALDETGKMDSVDVPEWREKLENLVR